MFKIECFCEDKYLGDILQALAQHKALDVKQIPVTNAKATRNGKIEAVTSGDVVDLMRHWIKQHKLTRITARDAKQFQSDMGRSPMGYSHMLRTVMDAGLLKRAKGAKGTKSGYDVVAGK